MEIRMYCLMESGVEEVWGFVQIEIVQG